MKRLIALTLFCTFLIGNAANGQSICPKNEVLQFGNLFGYTTMICKKDAEGTCASGSSDVVYFFINRVNDMGCGFEKNCGSCRTSQVSPKELSKTATYYAYQHNFSINRANNVNSGVFLDATRGYSKTKGFKFASVGEEKEKKYYAIFEISIKYQLPESESVEYLAGPVALQLGAKPPVSDFLEAKVDKANLLVTEGEQESPYALILRDTANQVFLKSPLMKRVATDPIGDPPEPKKEAKK